MSIPVEAALWIDPIKQVRHPELTLLCFPFLGADATIYRSWEHAFGGNIAIHGVQYPGRGRRMREAPLTDWNALCANAAQGLQSLYDHKCVLFGHSMGGNIAFEVARILSNKTGIVPRHLFVSASKPPHSQLAPRVARPRRVSELDDPALIEELRSLNGTPQELLDNSDALRYFLPTLRADFKILESIPVSGGRVDCPITGFCGTNDEVATRSAMLLWSEMTTTTFELRLVPGDHFFLLKQRDQLLNLLKQTLRQ